MTNEEDREWDEEAIISESGEIHRDDLDLDVVEQLERYMEERYPGSKLIFSGDIPEDERDEEHVQKYAMQAEMIDAKMALSRNFGYCNDCGLKMDGFPKVTLYPDDPKKWNDDCEQYMTQKFSEGWGYTTSYKTGQLLCFICPECHMHDKKVRLEIGGNANESMRPMHIDEALGGWDWQSAMEEAEKEMREVGGFFDDDEDEDEGESFGG